MTSFRYFPKAMNPKLEICCVNNSNGLYIRVNNKDQTRVLIHGYLLTHSEAQQILEQYADFDDIQTLSCMRDLLLDNIIN
jgi:hypothetical protein